MSSRSPSETRPLLGERPNNDNASYHSTSSGTITPTTSPESVPDNKISRIDLIWVLAGLWSAVFLGALDGMFSVTRVFISGT